MIGAIKRRWKSNKKVKGVVGVGEEGFSSHNDKVLIRPPPSPRGVEKGVCERRRATLPCAGDQGQSVVGAPFIQVNSGRIELHPSAAAAAVGGGDYGKRKPWPKHMLNDSRHSWCGTGGPADTEVCIKSPTIGTTRGTEERALVESLKERLTILEKVTKGHQEQGHPPQQEIVTECKAMASQLQALEQRVITLETNNKALTTIVLPTLMRLVKEAATIKPIKSTSKTSTTTTPIINSNTYRKSSSSSKASSQLRHSNNNNNKPIVVDMFSLSSTSPSHVPRVPSTSPPHTDPELDEVPTTPKKISKLQQKLSSSSTTSTSECRIPRMTHPPRSTPSSRPSSTSTSATNRNSTPSRPTSSGSPNNNKTPEKSKPPRAAVSRLPVFRKSTTTTTTTPNNKPLALPSKPKADEGYSTMSSEALAEQPEIIPVQVQPKTTLIPKSSTFTSSSSKASSRITHPSKGTCSLPHPISSTGGTGAGLLTATASVLEPTQITTHNKNVRIVHGSPYEIQLAVDADRSSTSLSTVLWEDSDDSDILFMPIELSEESDASTLVPTSSRESYTSWTTPTPTVQKETALPVTLGVEEQAFVEKWMRLEDVRNEEATWEEHWAWDWDGVLNHTPKKDSFYLHGHGHKKASSPILLSSSKKSSASPSSKKSLSSSSSSPHKEIDSSTWTKSTKRKWLEQQKKEITAAANNNTADCEEEDEDGPPPPIEFSVEFYRLASYGSGSSFGASDAKNVDKRRSITTTENKDKQVVQVQQTQTDDDGAVDGEGSFINSELFAQCQNCLDVISKLVTTSSESKDEDNEYATIDSYKSLRNKEEGLKSTWLKVPPSGYNSSQVENYLATLSSSESEEALISSSPSK